MPLSQEMIEKQDIEPVLAKLREAQANGNPADYVCVISVADARALDAEITRLRAEDKRLIRRCIDLGHRVVDLSTEVTTLKAKLAEAVEGLTDARNQLERVIGDHIAPNDCYATGPLTGDPIRDLVSCPSCEGEQLIAELDRTLATLQSKAASPTEDAQ